LFSYKKKSINNNIHTIIKKKNIKKKKEEKSYLDFIVIEVEKRNKKNLNNMLIKKTEKLVEKERR
jgi:hypothetical protein